jgi:hypothetical protein
MSLLTLTPEDFRTLPADGARFEALVCQLLKAMGYRILEKPAIGPDGGGDVLVERNLVDSMGERTEKVVVQCKHYAHSRKSVRDRDVGVWQNAMTRYKARGYLLVTDSRVAQNLSRSFLAYTEDPANASRWADFWDVDDLIRHLTNYPDLCAIFFGTRHSVDISVDPPNAVQSIPATITNEVPAEAQFARRAYFDHLIERHTRLFAGREGQCNDILEFIRKKPSGYIFIESWSGYGKTSLLAKLVQENQDFAYHFISQAYKTHGSDFDPTQMDSLVLNLCEQLETHPAVNKTGISPKGRLHSLLRTAPTSGSRVIVIDAIDEVDRHPNYLLGLFPERLPHGVFVILSARKLGDHHYLSEIGLEKVEKTIPLDGLDTIAITQLLILAGGKAPSFASSDDFVTELLSVSSGDPFYLRFLIEDVAQGSITKANIRDVPSKLNDYLDMQLSILDRSAHKPQQRDILGVILEAYGPVSRRDLIDMIQGLDGINFQNVIKDIQRFLLVYDDMYTFCHNRFKEYFISRA